MMADIKDRVEALVFSYGDGISIEEIQKRLKADPLIIKRTIDKLNKEYEERKSAFYISSEGGKYIMRLRSDLIPVIKDTLKTDMKQGVLMTLSVISMNGKMKQSDLIKARGNVAYSHVKELVSRGLVEAYYIDHKKYLKLTDKFYNYFDVEKKEFKEITQELKEDTKLDENKVVDYMTK